MIKDGKIFGIVNIIDFSIVAIILLGLLGVFLVKSGRFVTSANVIQRQTPIEFDVVIRGQKLSKDEPLLKKGDNTFITIRNVPYTSLEIVKSARTPWQTVIPDPKNPSKALAVTDPTTSYTYNFLVTLKDDAVITQDGAVIGGNKIKIGLPVTLEGHNYRLMGVVSDVKVPEAKAAK